MKEKSENIGFILDVQSNNGFHFSTMKWQKNFKCQSNRFLSYVKNVLSVCITMYYLSEKGRFKRTANALGITKNTVSMIIQRVTKAILNHLAEKYIKLPRTEEEVN